MGWELRHGGRWYLYRNRRVNGKPVKQYVAAKDPYGLGDEAAHELHETLESEAEGRRVLRQGRAEFRGRIDGLHVDPPAANAELGAVAAGILTALGYHRHNREEWRMRRDIANLKTAIEALKVRAAGPTPLVKYEAPTGDAEALEVFAKARAGDAAALDRVHAMIRERKWVDWLGDIGKQATRQLVWKAAGGDRVWEAGITQKANALREQLLGEKPTVLEELLVRRVVNGWLAVHALELEQTVRPPLEPRDRAHLDTALSRPQKRMTEAIGELARVRRLQAPKILAQVNVAASPTVVNELGTWEAGATGATQC